MIGGVHRPVEVSVMTSVAVITELPWARAGNESMIAEVLLGRTRQLRDRGPVGPGPRADQIGKLIMGARNDHARDPPFLRRTQEMPDGIDTRTFPNLADNDT
jgi:hypothetical protein